MMPYCEYAKCSRVATKKLGLLRTWDSYDFRKSPTHVQDIWVCEKHHKKISKLLSVKTHE